MSSPIPNIFLDLQPFVPDFWDSSIHAKATTPQPEESLPKLLVVAGPDTHHAGGPSHNLLVEHEPSSDIPEDVDVASPSKHLGQGSLWDDVAEDLGIPPPQQLKSTLRGLLN